MDYIQSNNISELKQVIKQNFDLNFKIEYDPVDVDQCVTPLITASHLGRTEVVDLLMNNKLVGINLASEPNGRVLVNVGFTPLMVTCLNGNYEIVQLLLDNDANVTATNALGKVRKQE
jgi:ankyrin repeat protein